MAKSDFATGTLGEKKQLLGVEEMLATPNVYYKEVDAWGGTVRLASLNAEEMIEFVEGNEDPLAKRRAGVRMVIKSLVNAEGARIGKDPEHTEAFLKKDAGNVNRLIAAVMELNGLTKGTAEEAKNASGEAGSAASPTS